MCRSLHHKRRKHCPPLAVAVRDPVLLMDTPNAIHRPLAEILLPLLCGAITEIRAATHRLDRVRTAQVGTQERTIAPLDRPCKSLAGQFRSLVHFTVQNRIRRLQPSDVEPVSRLCKVAASPAGPTGRSTRLDLGGNVLVHRFQRERNRRQGDRRQPCACKAYVFHSVRHREFIVRMNARWVGTGEREAVPVPSAVATHGLLQLPYPLPGMPPAANPKASPRAANFAYTALNTSGERVRGTIAGASEQAVMAELESRSLVPVEIAPAKLERVARKKPPFRKLGEAYGQIADLLHAGVPLLRVLRLLGQSKSNPAIAAIFREVGDDVADGADLAHAMSQRPDSFPQVHTAMVRAGEKGGFLEQVFSRLSQLVIAQAELRAKIIGNLIYPGILITLGSSVCFVIFGFFVPKMRPMFEKMEGGLPWITRVVFTASDLVGKYGPFTAIAVAAIAFGFWQLQRRANVRVWLSQRLTSLPVVGPIRRALATVRFCQLLGTMLNNGVPMLAALAITRNGVGDHLLEHAVDEASHAVQGGQALAKPLAESGYFEPDVIEMVAVGESANNLDEVLLKIARNLEQRIDRMLTIAVRLIEPLLLVMIALIVVAVAMAIVIPMTQMASNLR